MITCNVKEIGTLEYELQLTFNNKSYTIRGSDNIKSFLYNDKPHVYDSYNALLQNGLDSFMHGIRQDYDYEGMFSTIEESCAEILV